MLAEKTKLRPFAERLEFDLFTSTNEIPMRNPPANIWDAYDRVKKAIEDGEFDGDDVEYPDVIDSLCDELGLDFKVVDYMYDQAWIEIEEEDA